METGLGDRVKAKMAAKPEADASSWLHQLINRVAEIDQYCSGRHENAERQDVRERAKEVAL